MKANKIGILALSGLILAVIASGTAFAQNTWIYPDNTFATHWDGSSGSLDTSVSGNPGPVASGDVIQWYNTMANYVRSPVTVYVNAFSTADGKPEGLYYNENTVNVPAASSNTPGYGSQWHSASIQYSGSYKVTASQSYNNGLIDYTVNNGINMLYH